jgi:hypothetical protein
MKRILYSDNGTLTDYSTKLSSYHSGEMQFTAVADEDAIYIGSDLPFNHIYVKLSDVNSNAATVTIQYWDDDQWRDVVDTIDETSDGTNTLAQSGFITWTPHRDYGWTRESTNDNSEEVTGLTDVVIYDLYWAKITFSVDLTADVKINWIGQVFSNDDDLYSEFPEFSNTSFKTAFEAGKTTWEEQHIRAAELIIDDLQKKNIIQEKDQILERSVFKNASICKVAQIIYSAMGDDFADQVLRVQKEYYSRLNKLNFKTDISKDGFLSIAEKKSHVGNLIR